MLIAEIGWLPRFGAGVGGASIGDTAAIECGPVTRFACAERLVTGAASAGVKIHGIGQDEDRSDDQREE